MRWFGSYFHNRLLKLRELRWETGAVLPDFLCHDTLSSREKEYFSNYSSLLAEYNQHLGLDLTMDLEVHYCELRLFIAVTV